MKRTRSARLKNPLRLLPLFIAGLFLLTGCQYQVPLNDRLLVQAIGIDYEDGVYEATMQISRLTENEDTQVEVYRAKGASALDSLNRITMARGNRPMYSHSLIIVLGRSCAEHGLENTLDFFVRNPEADLSVDMLMADEKAGDILSMKSEGLYISAKDIKAMADSGQYNGRVARVRLVDLVNSLRMESGSACLPVIHDDKGKPVMDGTAIFSGGQLKNTITSGKTRGMLLVLGKITGGAEVLDVPNVGKVTFELLKVKSKIKPEIKDGIPSFQIQIDCEAFINALDVPPDQTIDSSFYDLFERLLSEQLKRQCEETLQVCVTQSRSDVFHFSRRLMQGQTEYWRAHEKDWPSLMGESVFQVSVKTKIVRTGQELTPQL